MRAAENLRVTARTSAFVFRGEKQNIREIGEKLNVSSVLEGSVRKAGNRVRISVQLIDVADGNNLWSERYDREMTDVFEIQDEISQAIVANLKVKLESQSGSGGRAGGAAGMDAAHPVKPLVKRYTENLDAYNLYLKGRFELYKMTREGLDASKKMFEEAIRLDPNYALAYDGLAYSWYQEGFLGFVAPKEAMPKAKAAVRRAIELDESRRRSACHAGSHSGALRLGLDRRGARADPLHRVEWGVPGLPRSVCVLLSAAGEPD